MNNFNLKDLDNIKVKDFFDFQGYVVFNNYFSTFDVEKLKLAISNVQKHDDVDLYYDRSGLLRRMENFIFKNDFLLEINRKIEKLLYKLTRGKQIIFKDKVNLNLRKVKVFLIMMVFFNLRKLMVKLKMDGMSMHLILPMS